MGWNNRPLLVSFCLLWFGVQLSHEGVSSHCGGEFNGSGTITSPNYPNHYPNNAACSWKLTSSSPNYATVVQIVDFALESNYDSLRIINGTKSITGYVPTYFLTGNYYVSKFVLGPVATIVLTTDDDTTDKGFQLKFWSATRVPYTACGGTISGSGMLRSPNYPSAYPNNSVCTWTVAVQAGNALFFRVLSFNTESNYDYLSIRNLNGNNLGPTLYYYSGNYGSGSVLKGSVGATASIEFVSDAAITAGGFEIEFTSLNDTKYTNCGGQLSVSGNLQTPNYPLNYPNSSYCVWKLAASAGSSVMLRFSTFNTESSYDWLKVYNGSDLASAPLVFSYSGPYYSGQRVTVYNRMAIVVFTSDPSQTFPGFSIEFTSVDTTTYTACGGELSGNGTIRSPLYPITYPRNSRCTWKISSSSLETVLQLRITVLDIGSSDTLLVYNSTANSIGSVTGYYSGKYYLGASGLRLTLGRFATLVFTSEPFQSSAAGFVVDYTSVNASKFTGCGGALVGSGNFSSPNYPQEYPGSSHCVWKLTAQSGKFIVLRLVDFNTESGYDYVYVYNGTAPAQPYSSFRYSGRYYGSNQRAVVGPSATVVFTSDGEDTASGFLIEFTSVDMTPYTACGGRLSGSGLIKSPHYPHVYPVNSRCTWNITTSNPNAVILLRFTFLNIENGADTLLVYNSTPDSLGNLVRYYSGNYYFGSTGQRVQLGRYATLVFSSDPVNTSAVGFVVEYESVSTTHFTACGREIYVSGNISSPNYPHHYPNNSLCTWRLIASTGKVVSLKLIEFNTESGYDYVRFYNGTTTTQQSAQYSYTGRYYGSIRSVILGPVATVVFTSDSSDSATGFRIEFKSIDITIQSGCGGELVGSGVLTSPGYPQPYPDNTECIWRLTALPGQRVHVRFADINTEGGYDFVHVYRGNQTTTLAQSFSGNYYFGNGRSLTLESAASVVFKSDPDVSSAGFLAFFTSIDSVEYTACGGMLNSQGTVYSPRFPNLYPPNCNCTWTLVASPGKFIQIRLSFLDVDSSGDFVRVFNSTASDIGPLVYSYSGNSYMSNARVKLGSYATLKFVSDSIISASGFAIEFTSQDRTTSYTSCGGLKSDSGVLYSPNYPDQYPSNATCTWTLTATIGKAIQLRVLGFNLENSYDYLRVYNGSSGAVSPIYTFTGQSYYYGTYSIQGGRVVTLRFNSDDSVEYSGFAVAFTSV